MLSILGGVAEFERSIIRERQREGIALAKRSGVYKGRAKKLNEDQAQAVRDRIAAGEHKATVARDLGISRPTLYQYMKGAMATR
jgi:DNA invertase Pin-like site-specific DNA recombinase